MKSVPSPFLFALIVLLSLPMTLRADEGEGILPPHPVDLYPGSVALDSRPDASFRTRLTKDRLETVRKFYDSRKIAGDRWVTSTEGNQSVATLNTYKRSGQKEQAAFELELTGKDEYAGASYPGFIDLQAQVQMGRHTQEEYQALVKKYGGLYRAFFRRVLDDEGEAVGEDVGILRRAEQAAHPDSDKPKAPDAATQAAGKARAKDLKQRMQALKAKGDIAGMLRLASEGRNELPVVPSVEESTKSAQRDTWDIWVKCLKDLEAAAYWTRIDYAEGALPEAPGK
jgi:hypothetical protein